MTFRKQKQTFTRRDFLKWLSQVVSLSFFSYVGWKTQQPKGAWAALLTKTPLPRPTFRPSLTPLPSRTTTPTITRMPTWTLYPSATSRPTRTLTPTITSTPSITPDRFVSIYPNEENFELVADLIAKAVNTANIQQNGLIRRDSSDLNEYYYDFDQKKYKAFLNGDRPYKYLKFTIFRKTLDLSSKVYVKAIVLVEDGTNNYSHELEYLDIVLNYLRIEHKVDISKITPNQKFYIARDISENAHRFTCVKFLRFVWALFGVNAKTEKGIFPAIYQASIINAADLSYQLIGRGGKSIFDDENKSIVKLSPIDGAFIMAENPETRPQLFDGKIVIFFRKERVESEPGHVGVGKLIAEKTSNGEFKRFLFTSLEVDGYTGQAHYSYREDLDSFRDRFYNTNGYIPPKSSNGSCITRRMIGWMFNRQ